LGEQEGPERVLIRHSITQSDLAAMAGVARESVSRTLREWQRQNILQGSSRTGYVVNMPSLVGVATE
jgi:CRP/FNR family transcriptional regulator